jgi:predicted amidohydrolase
MPAGTLVVALAQRASLRIEDPLPAFAADVDLTLQHNPGVELLVYPELHLCGTEHVPTSERPALLESHAYPLNSDFVAKLGAIAREHGIWLCPGSIGERGPHGEFFNTQLLFAPTGRLRGSYRKMFPWRPFEPHLPGTEFVVEDLDGSGVAGFSICYDAWFPEHSRQLAWMGADLILNIVKTTTPDREQELVLARSNAIVNQNVVASVNCAGPVGRGRSIVVGPEGFVIAEAGVEEETLVFSYDPADVARVRENGTMGSNRMWEQFRDDDTAIPLPMYDGRIDPQTWHPKRR